ncbi:uncharacterized protein LOC110688942 isoform X2 [Chenopodium quinoa]|nr:uncharacterized protein LOC110688942 isoform X2 [Chenopodium quinoa]
MKELRLEVADYCFVENYSGVDDSETIFHYSEVYQLNREEFSTLIPGQLISSRVMDCFYILLNLEEVLTGFTYNRVFIGDDHMWPVLQCLFAGDGCVYERDVYGAWDTWFLNVKCTDILTAKLVFMPIWYDNHYAVVVVNFLDNTIDYLDNRKYSIYDENLKKYTTKFDGLHSVYYSITYRLRYLMSRYMTIKGREDGVDVVGFPIQMIKLDGQKVGQNVDCGVFCLYHCASYFGKTFRSYCLNQVIQRRRYRAEICASLVLSDLNNERKFVLSRADQYVKNHEMIMAEVLQNEKLIKEAEIEAYKVEQRADYERRRKAKVEKEEAALVAATIAAEEDFAKRKLANSSSATVENQAKEAPAEEAAAGKRSTRNMSAAETAPASAVEPAPTSKSKAVAVANSKVHARNSKASAPKSTPPAVKKTN